jgi:hypothetical protein
MRGNNPSHDLYELTITHRADPDKTTALNKRAGAIKQYNIKDTSIVMVG